MTFSVKKSCPHCQSQNTLQITNDTIHCSQQTCDFKRVYRCPICESSLADATPGQDAHGSLLTCTSCNSVIHAKRIANIINNLMRLSYTQRCTLCNGPTLYRNDANLSHRCFYFPKCSGQNSLFSAKQECLVFLDFETTGLHAVTDHIIEIGALKIDEDGFEETFEVLVKPPIALPPKITQITHITDQMLETAAPIETILPQFFEFIGNATLVAHNAEFDLLWLLIALEKQHLALPNNDVICTLQWAKQLKEGRAGLGALTKKYQIGHQNAHRALADAAATKELFFIFENKNDSPRPVKALSVYQDMSQKLQTASTYKKRSATISIP